MNASFHLDPVYDPGFRFRRNQTSPIRGDVQNNKGGEIALCTLGAINFGSIHKTSDLERPCKQMVRALDAVLDYQDYPMDAAKVATLNRRPLGIGITNFAYWMSKRGMTYSHPDLDVVQEFIEAWSWHLISASVDLAEERGPCPLFRDTKYADGVVPVDTYKKDVDELCGHVERMDWDGLRSRLQKHGIRNSTLMAIMPVETSSLVSNSTNGIEPPRAPVTMKQSKDGVIKVVVPGYPKLKNKFEYLWDQKSPKGYLSICAVMQKFIDQAISVNTSYNPLHYGDAQIPMSELLGDLMFCYKYGLKTSYYFQTNDQSQDTADLVEDEEGEDGPQVCLIDDPDCEACKI